MASRHQHGVDKEFKVYLQALFDQKPGNLSEKIDYAYERMEENLKKLQQEKKVLQALYAAIEQENNDLRDGKRMEGDPALKHQFDKVTEAVKIAATADAVAPAPPLDSPIPAASLEQLIADSVLGKRADVNPLPVDGGTFFQCDEATAKLFSQNLADLFCVKEGWGNKYPGPHQNGQYGIMLTPDNMHKLEDLAKHANDLRAIKELAPDIKLADVSIGAKSLQLYFADPNSAKAFAKAAQIKEPENNRTIINLGDGALKDIARIVQERERPLQHHGAKAAAAPPQTPEQLVAYLLGDKVGYSTQVRPAMVNRDGKWEADPVKKDIVLVFKSQDDAIAVRHALKAPPYGIGGQGTGGMKAINAENGTFTIKLTEDNIQAISNGLDKFSEDNRKDAAAALVGGMQAKQGQASKAPAPHAKPQAEAHHGLG